MSTPYRFQLRRGTSTEWAAANPVLLEGEPGLDIDVGSIKYGDGVTAWDGLPFVAQGPKGDRGPAPRIGSQRFALGELLAEPPSSPQTTPTYDGSGQAVHPDVVYVPEGWGSDTNGKAWPYWMAMTPYPNGNDAYENPSILVSDDGDTWQVPPGLTNPIAAPPVGFWPDPDLILVDDRLYCLWAGGRAAWSDDGITWSAPFKYQDSLTGELSPAAVHVDGQIHVWSVVKVDAGLNRIIRRTGDSLETAAGWSDPVDCTFTVPDATREAWHIDVVKQVDIYLAAVAVGNGGGSANTVLYLASSRDGLSWDFAPEPILTGRKGEWDATNIYRASILPATGNGGTVADLWYSARADDTSWHIGRTRITWRDPELDNRAPLATIARHADTVEAKATTRNILANPTLLLPIGTRPLGTTNNLIGASGHTWDATREAYQFDMGAGGGNLDIVGIPAAPGESFAFAYDAATAVGGRELTARLLWRDGAGASLGSAEFDDTRQFPAAGEWARIQLAAVAPAGTATVTVIMLVRPGPATRVWFRRAQLEKSSGPTAWTPGPATRHVAQSGQTGNLTEWLGPVTPTGQTLLAAVTKDGAIRLARYTTANRPAAATAGEGAVIYDDTLNLPIFSDGTTWKNFAGTAL